jgi:cysteine protease ATG4
MGRTWGRRCIGIWLGIDGVNPVYYNTIKVCDSFLFFHMRSIDVNMKALYTFPPSVRITGGCPLSSYHFVGSQADDLFYLDPYHTCDDSVATAHADFSQRATPPGPQGKTWR